MKITGLEVWILEPQPNYAHCCSHELSLISPTRQLGIARISTDEGIEGVVSWYAYALKELARRWAACRQFS